MTKTEFPGDERSVEDQSSDHNGQNETGYEAKDGIRVRKRHDGETDVLREEKGRSLIW